MSRVEVVKKPPVHQVEQYFRCRRVTIIIGERVSFFFQATACCNTAVLTQWSPQRVQLIHVHRGSGDGKPDDQGIFRHAHTVVAAASRSRSLIHELPHIDQLDHDLRVTVAPRSQPKGIPMPEVDVTSEIFD